MVWLLSGAYMLHFGASWHLDLRVYRAAGHALYYGGSPFTAYFTSNHLLFTYTPFALLVLSPLTFGPLGLIETGWWLLSAASMVTAAFLLLRTTFSLSASRSWAVAGLLCGVGSLALEPVRSNFDYGQINLILMVMIVADLTWVRPSWRGVLVGVAAAIKLTPLIFLFYFVVDRDRRSLLRGIGAFIAVTGLSWSILPTDSTRYWFHQITDASRTGVLGVVSNQSWNGMVHRAPFDGGHTGTAVWVVLSVGTLVLGVSLTRRLVEQSRTAAAIYGPRSHRASRQPSLVVAPLGVVGAGSDRDRGSVGSPAGRGHSPVGPGRSGRGGPVSVDSGRPSLLPGEQRLGTRLCNRARAVGGCRGGTPSRRSGSARSA